VAGPDAVSPRYSVSFSFEVIAVAGAIAGVATVCAVMSTDAAGSVCFANVTTRVSCCCRRRYYCATEVGKLHRETYVIVCHYMMLVTTQLQLSDVLL